MIQNIMDFLTQNTAELVKTELLVAAVLMGALVVLCFIFAVFWLLIKLVEGLEEPQDNPMDMFMGGRNQGGNNGKKKA